MLLFESGWPGSEGAASAYRGRVFSMWKCSNNTRVSPCRFSSTLTTVMCVNPEKGHRWVYVLGLSQLPGAKSHSGDQEEKLEPQQCPFAKLCGLWLRAMEGLPERASWELFLSVFVGLASLSADSHASCLKPTSSDWVPPSPEWPYQGLVSFLPFCLFISLFVFFSLETEYHAALEFTMYPSHYVPKDDLKLLILLPHVPSARIGSYL